MALPTAIGSGPNDHKKFSFIESQFSKAKESAVVATVVSGFVTLPGGVTYVSTGNICVVGISSAMVASRPLIDVAIKIAAEHNAIVIPTKVNVFFLTNEL